MAINSIWEYYRFMGWLHTCTIWTHRQTNANKLNWTTIRFQFPSFAPDACGYVSMSVWFCFSMQYHAKQMPLKLYAVQFILLTAHIADLFVVLIVICTRQCIFVCRTHVERIQSQPKLVFYQIQFRENSFHEPDLMVNNCGCNNNGWQ